MLREHSNLLLGRTQVLADVNPCLLQLQTESALLFAQSAVQLKVVLAIFKSDDVLKFKAAEDRWAKNCRNLKKSEVLNAPYYR